MGRLCLLYNISVDSILNTQYFVFLPNREICRCVALYASSFSVKCSMFIELPSRTWLSVRIFVSSMFVSDVIAYKRLYMYQIIICVWLPPLQWFKRNGRKKNKIADSPSPFKSAVSLFTSISAAIAFYFLQKKPNQSSTVRVPPIYVPISTQINGNHDPNWPSRPKRKNWIQNWTVRREFGFGKVEEIAFAVSFGWTRSK